MFQNHSAVIAEGLGNNILITVLASIVPAAVGTGLTFLVGHVNKKGLRLPLRIISGVLYSFAPIALMMFIFFNLMASVKSSGILPAILAISISHLGFYMMCYDASASIPKNIVVNSLGMLTSAFLWSTAVGYIGGIDVVQACNMIRARTFDPGPIIYVLLICFGILVVLNVPRMILKEVMK